MRLLYLCHRVPFPPNKGEKIRAYHHLAHLSKGHRVHLACLADTRSDFESARSLETMCASVDVVYRSPTASNLAALAALPTGRSLSVAAFDSPALRARVERRKSEAPPDVLVAYSAVMAQYIADATDRPRVLDFVDADSEKLREYGRQRSFPQSVLYALEAGRMARYEASMASAFDASIFISEAEAEIVRPRAPDADYHVIRNGVDLEAFRPDGRVDEARHPIIVFTGVMGYFPNVDAVIHFARDIFPHVREHRPDARFVIVGRDPVPDVRRLARHPGITVTGAVEDVRPYLADAAVAIAPFRIARGVQNKVLEAMACAVPVVGTSLAFQGLAAGDGDGIRVADAPEAFAAAVVALLRDPALRREQGQRARRYVERHHRWDEVGTALESLLLAVAEGRGARQAEGVRR